MTGLELWMVWTSITEPGCEIPPVEMADNVAMYITRCIDHPDINGAPIQLAQDGLISVGVVGIRVRDIPRYVLWDGEVKPLNTSIVRALKRRAGHIMAELRPSPELRAWGRTELRAGGKT